MNREQLTLEPGFRSEAGHAISTQPLPQVVSPVRTGRVGRPVADLAEVHAKSIINTELALGIKVHNFQTCPACIGNGHSFRAQVRQLIGDTP